VNVASMDIRRGPDANNGFEPGQTVTCTYAAREMGGHTPKFTCKLPPDDEFKVKFGKENGEVYGEVIGTRLLWALGFGADRMYPVHVRCHGCPFDETGQRVKPGDVEFQHAVIERKYPGETMESRQNSGWTWPELDLPRPEAGGAPRAHRDALKLLAAFIQHTDSKAEQQRLLCEDGKHERKHDKERACEHPFMMISDLGQTFGRANVYNRDAPGSVNFGRWSSTPVWRDAARCVAFLPESLTGTLADPLISEEGRAFLAGLMARLSDRQLTDLFELAGVTTRSTDPNRSGTPAEWVAAFREKRRQILNARCPN
jgi:hypothetical protein